MVGGAPSCALLGGFAIGARVSSLWQHSAACIGNQCTWQCSGDCEMSASTCLCLLYAWFPLMIWCCWLGDRKGSWPVKFQPVNIHTTNHERFCSRTDVGRGSSGNWPTHVHVQNGCQYGDDAVVVSVNWLAAWTIIYCHFMPSSAEDGPVLLGRIAVLRNVDGALRTE